MKTQRQVIGKIGEDIVIDHYNKENYSLVERNYLRKWGEIDLILQRNKKMYFVEVKTITRSYTCNINSSLNYRAVDNMHFYKGQRLKRAIQSFLANLKREVEWQFDVITVILAKEDLELIKIERLENVIL